MPFTYLIARLSIRLHIPPQALLELDQEMLQALMTGLKDEAKELKDANRNPRKR
jgi:hypothetical protein